MANENGGTTGAAQNGGTPQYVAAECGACAGRFKLRRWREGIQCPKCKGGELMPAVPEGGAVDYFVADRSGGYAQADIRFAQWAKWSDLITPHQYEMAFRNQNKSLQQGEAPQPIHSLMVAEGWLTQRQATALLEFMCRRRPDQYDQAFAEAAVRTGIVQSEDLEKAEQLQAKISEKANETPALCQIMLEKRIINENKMLTLLKNLQTRGQGPLAGVAEALSRPGRARPAGGGIQKSLAGNKTLLWQGALILALFILALGVWHLQTREPVELFPAICDSCGETSEIRYWATEGLPVVCPECGERSAYWRFRCVNGHEFPVNLYLRVRGGRRCPDCDTDDVRALKMEDLE